MNWNLFNPLATATKKFLFELMGNEYPAHSDMIERLSASITTEKDYEQFAKLVLAVYEKGYKLAVDQHKEILEKQGLKVTVTKPEGNPNGSRIFHSEKSG